MKKTVMFLGEECSVHFAKYDNGRNAIKLTTVAEGEPMTTATVNLVEVKELADDEVIIKTYSENAGMLEVLVHAGIVDKPIRWEEATFITCPVCKILVNPEDYK